jgi:hypothetical protein
LPLHSGAALPVASPVSSGDLFSTTLTVALLDQARAFILFYLFMNLMLWKESGE